MAAGPWRFDHSRQLMAYLGLVPTENTSDQKRRQGGITKTGNGPRGGCSSRPRTITA